MNHLCKRYIYFWLFFSSMFLLLLLSFPCIIGEKKTTAILGPTTAQQVELSFENAVEREYACISLGNSRIYRGINPEKLFISTYNFAHDNDAFNQSYYKLQYLASQGKKIKYIILGVDYFEFSFLSDTRNYIYNRYFARQYADDFPEKIFSLEEWMNRNIGLTKRLAIKMMYSRETDKRYIPKLKENGQFIVYGKATENDTVKREYHFLDIQKKYFYDILNYANQEGIVIVLVMPPTRQAELASYPAEVIEEYEKMFVDVTTSYDNVFYLNFSLDNDFSIADYTDITHLNEQAADRFTVKLNEKLKIILKNI